MRSEYAVFEPIGPSIGTVWREVDVVFFLRKRRTARLTMTTKMMEIVTPMPAFAPVDRPLWCCSAAIEPVEDDVGSGTVLPEGRNVKTALLPVDAGPKAPADPATKLREAKREAKSAETLDARSAAFMEAAPEAPAEAATRLKEAKREAKSAEALDTISATLREAAAPAEAAAELREAKREANSAEGDSDVWAHVPFSRVAKRRTWQEKCILAKRRRRDKDRYVGWRTGMHKYMIPAWEAGSESC
jgi:hypothetical protein